MSITYSKAHDYATAYSSPEPKLIAKIKQDTYDHVPGASMLSEHLQGRLLATFSHMLKPKRILEIGTYTGYSTLCLAEGLDKEGIIYTIDSNKLLADKVKEYFLRARKTHQIRYYLGKALEIIPDLREKFDVVFIDADKKNYALYYDLTLEKLHKNGFLIIDNVFWKGKVFEKDLKKIDKRTECMINFNNKIRNDPRVEHVLIPIRDGLMLVRKK